MRIDFDFGDLRAFLALMETGSFRQAAETLNISQSALSRRLQKLETALGTQLAERTTRNVRPTLAARAFQDRATAILAEAEAAVAMMGDAAARDRRQRAAVVTVAAVPTATRSLLPAAIRKFRAEGFAGRIRVADLSAGDVLSVVADGEADFGVNFIGAQEPGLDFLALADDPFVLAMRRDDPMAGAKTVRWRDIDPQRYIAVWKGSGNRLLIDAALAQARIQLAWAYETRHLSTALDLVEAGLGVAALPASAMPDDAHPLLTARPLTSPDISRAIGLIKRANARLSAAAEGLYGTLAADGLS